MRLSSRRREKVFGPGRAVPLDRNAKARILAYAKAWSARNRQPRQRTRGRSPGPSWRCWRRCYGASTTADPVSASRRDEAIAVSAECNRDTVYEALKVLEWAGVLTWQNRIARIQVRERDLFDRWASRWRVIRTSNAYVFRDPLQRPAGVPASKSENPSGTGSQEIPDPVLAPAHDPNSPLERALRQLSGVIEGRLLSNGCGGPVPAS